MANTKITAANIDSTSTGITLADLTVNGDINLGDNNKAVFGAGSDLQIYHDGSNSFVADVGTGVLDIQTNGTEIQMTKGGAELMAKLVPDGAVTLYYDAAAKIATTSTGIDVTGTVVAHSVEVDGLLHIDGSDNSNVASFALTRTDASWSIDNETNFRIYGNTGDTTNPATKRFEIATGGDISFYEDTGTTAKFFWDASAESLGIGTTSPAFENGNGLEIRNSSGNGSHLKLTDNASGTGATQGFDLYMFNSQAYIENYENAPTIFRNNGGERMRIDSSGNVGIGESSPDKILHLKSSGTTGIAIESTTNAQNLDIDFYNNAGSAQGRIRYAEGAGSFEINPNVSGSAPFTILYGGNVGIGTTSPVSKQHNLITSSGTALLLNNSSGGTGAYVDLDFNTYSVTVAGYANAAATIRVIDDGSYSGDITFRTKAAAVDGSQTERMRITSSGNVLVGGITSPVNSAKMSINGNATTFVIHPAVDNNFDCGHPSYRWDDIRATNGTIQTSDRNDKQDIEALTDAETRVAVAAKGLLRKFRWQSAVEEKGDEARIHFGIIAQDLQDAFTAEGLDAGDYAMFISDTWWESEEVIPAVEEELDEDGNVVTEAQEERIVTNTYDSEEEAPEDAIEKTRLGVRYSELLAFIIAGI